MQEQLARQFDERVLQMQERLSEQLDGAVARALEGATAGVIERAVAAALAAQAAPASSSAPSLFARMAAGEFSTATSAQSRPDGGAHQPPPPPPGSGPDLDPDDDDSADALIESLHRQSLLSSRSLIGVAETLAQPGHPLPLPAARGNPHAVEAAYAHTIMHAEPASIGSSRGGQLVASLRAGRHTAGAFEAISLHGGLRALFDLHARLRAVATFLASPTITAAEAREMADEVAAAATQSMSVYQHFADRRAVLRALASGSDEWRLALERRLYGHEDSSAGDESAMEAALQASIQSKTDAAISTSIARGIAAAARPAPPGQTRRGATRQVTQGGGDGGGDGGGLATLVDSRVQQAMAQLGRGGGGAQGGGGGGRGGTRGGGGAPPVTSPPRSARPQQGAQQQQQQSGTQQQGASTSGGAVQGGAGQSARGRAPWQRRRWRLVPARRRALGTPVAMRCRSICQSAPRRRQARFMPGSLPG